MTSRRNGRVVTICFATALQRCFVLLRVCSLHSHIYTGLDVNALFSTDDDFDGAYRYRWVGMGIGRSQPYVNINMFTFDLLLHYYDCLPYMNPQTDPIHLTA